MVGAGDMDVEKRLASKPEAKSSEEAGTLAMLACLLTVVYVGLSIIGTAALMIISIITAGKKS